MRSYLGLVAQVCKAEEAIRAAYDKGYDDGFLDRQNEAPESCSEQHVSEDDTEALAAARAEGAEIAWRFALRCFVWQDTPERSFALQVGVEDMTYHEATSAFNEWTRSADLIKTPAIVVGSIVEVDGRLGVVTCLEREVPGGVYVLMEDGTVRGRHKKALKPTNMCIDLSGIFNMLKGE